MLNQTFPNDAKTSQAMRPVLVVDDSRAHRRLLSRSLEKWGFEVIEADSGEAGLEICRSSPIELVVSDWMMPGMSGIEFCRAFRDLVKGRAAYFILLTAQTEREVLAEGLESGADDFLSKPFSSIELRARLRAGERVLGAHRALEDKNDVLSSTLSKLSDAYEAIERDLNEARK
ncbi:MAG: response regulator, partial [Paracoccaceae bacterium]